jgi:hypothetical protein
MPMEPHVAMLMQMSLDGGLHPGRRTASPDGDRKAWSRLYERMHDGLDGDAWIVGRVTMAEMSKIEAHPPAEAGGWIIPSTSRTSPAGHSQSPSIHPRDCISDGMAWVSMHLLRCLDATCRIGISPSFATTVSLLSWRKATISISARCWISCGTVLASRGWRSRGARGINGAFLAARLVDEISLPVAPALDAGRDVQGIVA